VTNYIDVISTTGKKAMNRTDRLYAIVEELRTAGPGGRTAAWLARRFEVSTRTVKRDLSSLQQAGVPSGPPAAPAAAAPSTSRARCSR